MICSLAMLELLRDRPKAMRCTANRTYGKWMSTKGEAWTYLPRSGLRQLRWSRNSHAWIAGHHFEPPIETGVQDEPPVSASVGPFQHPLTPVRMGYRQDGGCGERRSLGDRIRGFFESRVMVWWRTKGLYACFSSPSTGLYADVGVMGNRPDGRNYCGD